MRRFVRQDERQPGTRRLISARDLASPPARRNTCAPAVGRSSRLPPPTKTGMINEGKERMIARIAYRTTYV